MPDKLIDTNIPVYAYDNSETNKHETSKKILQRIWKEGNGIVCLQNLMEFFVVAYFIGLLSLLKAKNTFRYSAIV
jgi:predicted nucleic acid-binding protein